jgi:hypothetical protein
MMLKKLTDFLNAIRHFVAYPIVAIVMFGSGFFVATSCTTVRPMVVKYEYIEYPEFKGQLLDASVDLNTIPRRTLINQNVMMMNYIRKLLKRSDMIDYLYFNVNKDIDRYKQFEGFEDVKDVEEFKKLYREQIGDTVREPILIE